MHLLLRTKLMKMSASLALVAGLLTGGPAAAATRPTVCVLASQPGAGQAPAAAQAPASGIINAPGQAYIHVSTGSSICGDFTYLENPALNGQPARALLATENVAPYGLEASSLDHPQGVWYDSSAHRWALYNDDQMAMTLGRGWNVFIPPSDTTLIPHDSTALNSTGALTDIDGALFNGDPSAIVFVQHVYNPGASPLGAPFNYFTQTVGVIYDTEVGKWAIQTEDGTPFPFSKTFFVLRASDDETAFTHTVTAGNHLYPFATALDHPALNGNPDAQILITQNLDGGVANNHRVGVSYDDTSRRWLIRNLDGAALALGARFNVLVIPTKHASFLHTATLGNTTLDRTALDNPDLNDNPYPLIYVTHNWNPPVSNNQIYNDHPLGVAYLGGAWYIVNVDGAPMPVGATFNVYYTWGRGNSFLVSATATNSSGASTTLNNPLLNGQPNAIPIISANLSPAGLTGAIYTPTVGVRYYAPLSQWQVFNSGPTFNITQTYNVLIPSLATSFVVTASAPVNNYFDLDSLLTNNQPNVRVFVSARDNSGLNSHNVGVFYNTNTSRWAIFNENEDDAMPAGASYDVFVTGLQVLLPLVTK